MFIRTTPLILCAVLLAGTAGAEMRSTERAIETSTMSLRLPRALPASISLSPCDTCSSVSLAVTPQTQLFFGRKNVTLAELQKLTAGPTLNVAVYYETANHTVSRIVVTDRRQQ